MGVRKFQEPHYLGSNFLQTPMKLILAPPRRREAQHTQAQAVLDTNDACEAWVSQISSSRARDKENGFKNCRVTKNELCLCMCLCVYIYIYTHTYIYIDRETLTKAYMQTCRCGVCTSISKCIPYTYIHTHIHDYMSLDRGFHTWKTNPILGVLASWLLTFGDFQLSA